MQASLQTKTKQHTAYARTHARMHAHAAQALASPTRPLFWAPLHSKTGRVRVRHRHAPRPTPTTTLDSSTGTQNKKFSHVLPPVLRRCSASFCLRKAASRRSTRENADLPHDTNTNHWAPSNPSEGVGLKSHKHEGSLHAELRVAGWCKHSGRLLEEKGPARYPQEANAKSERSSLL